MLYKDIIQKNVISKPADTNPTVIYTVPTNRSAKVKIFAYNEGAGANNATISITRSGDSAPTIVAIKEIAASGTEILPSSELALSLASEESISVTSATGDEVTFTANVEEYLK